jgi:eukaryotic translation initiation factor 2C
MGHREEVVSDMKEDIKDLLKLYYERNRVKPESIVIYRDGVSQGEFKEVCLSPLVNTCNLRHLIHV